MSLALTGTFASLTSTLMMLGSPRCAACGVGLGAGRGVRGWRREWDAGLGVVCGGGFRRVRRRCVRTM